MHVIDAERTERESVKDDLDVQRWYCLAFAVRKASNSGCRCEYDERCRISYMRDGYAR